VVRIVGLEITPRGDRELLMAPDGEVDEVNEKKGEDDVVE
jgi:hypothetical protein